MVPLLCEVVVLVRCVSSSWVWSSGLLSNGPANSAIAATQFPEGLVMLVDTDVSPPAAILYQPAAVILLPTPGEDWGSADHPDMVPQFPPVATDDRPTVKINKLPAVAAVDNVAEASPLTSEF